MEGAASAADQHSLTITEFVSNLMGAVQAMSLLHKGVVSGEHVSCASYEMARTCDIGVRISQMDRRSFITHQVVFFQPVLSSRALPAVHSEVCWQMGRGLRGGMDVAPALRQDHIKQLDGLHPAFFSPILPETHVAGTLDQILHDPFPEQVGESYPIDLRLSIALKKGIGVWMPDKDEI